LKGNILVFFELIMTKSNFTKISYDVISVTSKLLRYQNTSWNKHHKIFPFWSPPDQNFWLRQWFYAHCTCYNSHITMARTSL